MNWTDFSLEKQKELLERWGYTIKKVKRTWSESVYHNDVEFHDYEVNGVFSRGKPVEEPFTSRQITEREWVKAAFDKILQEKFFAWLLNSDDCI